MRRALPQYSNEVIMMLQTTSLASIVTLIDITGAARTVNAQYYLPFEAARGKGRHVRIGQGAARCGAGSTGEVDAIGSGLLPGVIIGSGIPLGMLGYWLAVGSSAAFPVAEIGEASLSSLALSLEVPRFAWRLAVPVGLLVVRYKGQLAIWAERLPYLLHALPG